MFKIPRLNVIESSKGFSVEVLGRTGLEYKEGSKSIQIDSEVLAGPSGIVVYSKSINNWTSLEGALPIGEAERNKIIENIREAFRFRGVEIEIE